MTRGNKSKSAKIGGVSALVAVYLLAFGPAAAEVLRVRTGEHDGFTRLVIDGAAAHPWTLIRRAGGYELRLEHKETTYDTSRAFAVITRKRLADLVSEETGALHIKLDCDCHAKAFVTGSGALVIDIADGAAPPGSPFEAPVQPVASPTPVAEIRSPHPDIIERKEMTLVWLPPGTDFSRQAVTDPGLAFFWKGVAPMPETASKTEPSDADSDALSGTASEPDVPPLDPPLPSDPIIPHPPTVLPTLPDPQVAVAQEELLRQLGRAASQGLLEIDTSRLHLPGRGNDVETPHTDTGEGTQTPGQDEVVAPGMTAETSIDRDAVVDVNHVPVTAEGITCARAEELDIASWGDDRPAPLQIAERRSALVGEFDRPSVEAVLTLSRLYIYLGFGAEARGVLTAFDISPDRAGSLEDMALIVDGEARHTISRLAHMTDCDTPAALWAVLASPELSAGTAVDQGAVLLAFSALPPHLRRNLGPELSKRLLAVGAEFAARSVRDAIARSSIETAPALDLIDARLNIAAGHTEAAERHVDSLARGNNALAKDALILALRSKLDRGEPVEPGLIDSVAALAFERQDGVDGPVLSQLYILSLGSSGALGEAFDAFARWPGQPSRDIRASTALQLFAMLASDEDEAEFLKLYFSQHALLDTLDAPSPIRLALAARLSAAGFADEVVAVLAGEAGQTDEGRHLLADAALGRFDPDTALAELDGLTDETANAMRARALTMVGHYRQAEQAYTAAGDLEAAARAAWRGGNWAGVVEDGPDPMRHAIVQLDLLPAAPTSADVAPSPVGELAHGRLLLSDSQAIRTTLGGLLTATEDGG